MDKNISFTLKVWRQAGPKAKGAFETYQMKDIPGDTSFLEMLDILNEQLLLPARFICVASTTVTPLPLNLGVRPVSLLSRT